MCDLINFKDFLSSQLYFVVYYYEIKSIFYLADDNAVPHELDENDGTVKHMVGEGVVLATEDTHSSTLETENSIPDQVHYVTSNDSDQPVTIVYPDSTIPLLSTNDGLMNLVEIPGVGSTLQLDQSAATLNYDTGMVIQQTLTNQGQIAVMTDVSGDPLSLLSGENSNRNNADHNASYYEATEVSNTEETLIQIPTNDIADNNQTITLPLSFLSDSGAGVSILQGFGQLPLSLGGGDPTSDTITLRAPIDADTIISSSNNQNYMLSEIPTSLVAVSSSNSGDNKMLFSQDQIPQHTTASTPVQPKISFMNSNSKSLLVKPFANQNKLGTNLSNKKLIGTGPMAISAQGVVQKVGNRLVTVLPRPEDLKKLYENKALVLGVPGTSNSSESSNTQVNQGRKVPVPIRPHQRYGRRGRGKVKSTLPIRSQLNNQSSVSLLNKDSNNSNESSAEIEDPKLKESNVGDGNIVVDMMLPGGDSTSVVLLPDDPNEDKKFDLPMPSRRGRKRKRGRGRPRGRVRGTYVISSTGRRPGRPRKVETLVKGPHGARMIHTGPDTRENDTDEAEKNNQDFKLEKFDDNFMSTDESIDQMLQNLQSKDVSEDNLNDLSKESEIEVKYEPGTDLEEDIQDLNKRRLPPRKRGTR